MSEHGVVSQALMPSASRHRATWIRAARRGERSVRGRGTQYRTASPLAASGVISSSAGCRACCAGRWCNCTAAPRAAGSDAANTQSRSHPRGSLRERGAGRVARGGARACGRRHRPNRSMPATSQRLDASAYRCTWIGCGRGADVGASSTTTYAGRPAGRGSSWGSRTQVCASASMLT